MDNEAPNYASWVPEAGGYVANGKVVSKSPMYDEAGKLRLDVDASLFGGTASQPTTTKAQPQVANNPLSNNGITTANTTGSGEDVNSMETKLGSMGSLNLNTENPKESVLSTPASKSPSAGEPILTPVQQALKELQDATARGTDFQAMINAYTKLGRLTGEDYSAEIADLTQQRQQKIENTDNDYANQIATAMMRGDTEEVARLRAEQSSWRNSVGYQDAMANKYEQARQDIDTDYQTTFWDGIRDIAGMVAQALPGILNFQYNPYTDTALQIAQGYATSRVKEQMNATGMYYSSMTQNAITKAVAELVPVYQKMAKEEAIQNFQLLQQTASFLVDLEQAQFNLWKGQLDVKFQANADKRAEIAAAWDKVNQLGYVDNETSAILGIPAGTESYATRKAYVDKLNQIDAEKRKLDQDKALSEFENGLAIQRMERQAELEMDQFKEQAKINYDYDIAKLREQNRLQKDYYSYQIKQQGGTTPSGTTTPTFDDATVQSKYESAIEGKNLNEAIKLLYDENASDNDKFNIADGILNNILIPNIDSYQEMFKSKDYKSTKNGINSALADIKQFAAGLEKFGISTESKRDWVSQAYSRLFDNIDTAQGFDWSKTNINDDPSSLKQKAKEDIINTLRKDSQSPEYVRTWIPAVLTRRVSPLDDTETATNEAQQRAQQAESAARLKEATKELTLAGDLAKKAVKGKSTGLGAAALAAFMHATSSSGPITYGNIPGQFKK